MSIWIIIFCNAFFLLIYNFPKYSCKLVSKVAFLVVYKFSSITLGVISKKLHKFNNVGTFPIIQKITSLNEKVLTILNGLYTIFDIIIYRKGYKNQWKKHWKIR